MYNSSPHVGGKCIIYFGWKFDLLTLFDSLPQISAFFPVLIGKLTALPAPRVETRQVKMPTLGGGMGIVSPLPTFRPLDVLARLFEKKSR